MAPLGSSFQCYSQDACPVFLPPWKPQSLLIPLRVGSPCCTLAQVSIRWRCWTPQCSTYGLTAPALKDFENVLPSRLLCLLFPEIPVIQTPRLLSSPCHLLFPTSRLSPCDNLSLSILSFYHLRSKFFVFCLCFI